MRNSMKIGLFALPVSLMAGNASPQSGATNGLCSWAAGAGMRAGDVRELILAEPPTSSSSVVLTRSRAQPDPAVELFRVTSAFFTRAGTIGVTNAGMNEIVVFDGTGSVTARLGARGAGPEEFGTLFFARMRPDEDIVLAYDFAARAAKEFTLSESFVRAIRLRYPAGAPIYDVHPLTNRGFIAVTSGSVRALVPGTPAGVELRSADALILVLDSTGRTVKSVAQVPAREKLVLRRTGGGLSSGDRPFASQPWIAVDSDGCFAHPVADEAGFIVRDLTGRALIRVRIAFVDLRIDDDEWEARLRRRSHATLELLDLEKPARRPAWRGALFDGRSRLWLEQYHHYDEPVEGWLVVDLTTSTAVRVRAPSGAYKLLAATGERAAILMRDENDVERVVLFDIGVPRRGEARLGRRDAETRCLSTSQVVVPLYERATEDLALVERARVAAGGWPRSSTADPYDMTPASHRMALPAHNRRIRCCHCDNDAEAATT